MKRIIVLLFVLLMFVTLTAIVWANDDDEGERGGKAPEVPFALIYPVAGFAAYGAYRFIRPKLDK